MAVSKKDVEYVAQLSRLNFSEPEKEQLINDLNTILNYMDKLNELDTEKVDILINPYYMENKFRDDVVKESLTLDDVLKNAPDKLEEYVMVPQVIEK